MLVVLKIPVVYLCAVVWWAIRAEPRPLEGAGVVASLGPPPPATGGAGAPARSGAVPAHAGHSAADGRAGRHARVRPRAGDAVSVDAHAEQPGRWTAVDTIAGLLATVSIFTSCVGLVYRPVRLIPFAILLALTAALMSERQQRLGGLAIAVAVVCWTLGMTIAVVTENPLY